MDLKVNFDFNIILSFIKKSKMFLIPVVICVSAFLILIPSIIIGGKVKAKAEDSKKKGEEISRMLSSDNSVSRQQIDVTKSYAERYQKDVDEVLNLAKQTTQRELISYNIFPPISTSQQIYTNFGKSCRQSIVNLMDKLGARDAPSDIEKNEATAHLGGVNLRAGRNEFGAGGNRRGGYNTNKSIQNVLDALNQKRAAEVPVYADVSLFRWYDYWDAFTYTTNEAAIEDCWFSQLSYWVYEDIVDTIVKVNSGSKSVSKSAVKRLLDINFTGDSVLGRTDGGGGYGEGGFGGGSRIRSSKSTAVEDCPVYITESTYSPFGVSDWTGRKCDDKIDVIHFSFATVIDASKIPVFMKELLSEKTHQFRQDYKQNGSLDNFKHNQITILEYNSVPIDRQSLTHQDYKYGDQPVVALEMVCEYIFHKDGYAQVIPEVVSKNLNDDD